MIFASLNIPSIRRYVYAHVYKLTSEKKALLS